MSMDSSAGGSRAAFESAAVIKFRGEPWNLRNSAASIPYRLRCVSDSEQGLKIKLGQVLFDVAFAPRESVEYGLEFRQKTQISRIQILTTIGG